MIFGAPCLRCAILGMPFSILSLHSSGGWWRLWTLKRLDAIEDCTVFMFPKLQMGAGKKYTHGFLIIDEHVWNPLRTKFSFPHAVGEGTVNTCWRDSGFCMNCHS